jgi:2-dehydro-3-deoxygluconokinase
MGKVLSFGELLLRMSPAGDGEWIENNLMPVYIGGAELNVAAALSKWNVPTAYFSAAPDNYLVNEIISNLKKKNIDIDRIILTGKKLGVYYLAQGKDLKHAAVIYDREHSSFSELKPGVIDWKKIFDGISWFHFSAISPALNSNIANVCKEGLAFAAEKNMIISVDLNHRPKLWQYGKKPVEVMPELVQYCDVVMGNIWAANSLLGIDVDEKIHEKGNKTDYLEHAEATSISLQNQFPKCKTIANTFRFDHGQKGILYYASLFNNGHQYHSSEWITDSIIDRVGSGDCFMAGLIYGLHNKLGLQNVINFASAAAFLKLQEKGDTTNQDIHAINALVNGAG